jgi:zinc transport system substrate-binding protein
MRLAPLLALLLVSTSGCAAFRDDSAAASGKIGVAAAFYPLAFVAQEVGGDQVAVTNLTQPGKEPHDLELDIKTTEDVADAQLVLVEHGFQPAVDDAVAQVATGDVLDVADVVDLEGDDPHFWQDPTRMATLTQAVADELADLDPDHAADFRVRAERLSGELSDLDTAYADGLRGCQRDTIVVSHDAFGYLGKYGLDIEGIAGLSPEAEPTPADLARLEDLIRSDGITTVFSERLVSPKLTAQLADDLGIRTEVLDPIEGLSDVTAGEDYLSLMRENLAALEQANGCPA